MNITSITSAGFVMRLKTGNYCHVHRDEAEEIIRKLTIMLQVPEEAFPIKTTSGLDNCLVNKFVKENAV